MHRTRCAIVSFRLGMADGVSVVAASWQRALQELGFDVVTVAGEGPVDRRVRGLAIDDHEPPNTADLAAALADAELVVVENLLTIPMRLEASRVVADQLRGRPTLLHHHDPPWQRDRYAHITELPPDDPAWRHVTINDLTRRQMAERGIEAVTIYNGFDTNPSAGDRDSTRALLGLDDATLLVAHPVRAIARKNIPAALEMTAALGGTYWLLGRAEEGYDAELARVLDAAACPWIHRSHAPIEDVYAAADLIAFPSTWEGFGNPPIEAALHRRAVAVGPYPVGAELAALGFDWFAADDIGAIAGFLSDPDPALLERNRSLAEEHFSYQRVLELLATELEQAGWLP
ncbi:MAG: glycosyltransferase family 4 protein [Acidimicrobiia bacterium]|nr:glycosyltransferase family 4 protein [Acidimicrobiia bacterium]